MGCTLWGLSKGKCCRKAKAKDKNQRSDQSGRVTSHGISLVSKKCQGSWCCGPVITTVWAGTIRRQGDYELTRCDRTLSQVICRLSTKNGVGSAFSVYCG